MNMKPMTLLLVIGFLFMVGCTSLEKKKQTPPSVSTQKVIDSLNDTKSNLEEAGQSNTKVAEKIDKALTLAQRLDVLIDQIEKEQQKSENKQTVKPIQ